MRGLLCCYASESNLLCTYPWQVSRTLLKRVPKIYAIYRLYHAICLVLWCLELPLLAQHAPRKPSIVFQCTWTQKTFSSKHSVCSEYSCFAPSSQHYLHFSAPSSWHSNWWKDGMQHAFACRSVHFSKPFLGKHRKPSESRSSKSIVPILSRTGCVGISHHIPSWFHGPHFSYSEEVFQMGKNCLEFANNPSKSHHGLLTKLFDCKAFFDVSPPEQANSWHPRKKTSF